LGDLSYRRLTLNRLFDEDGQTALRAGILEHPDRHQSFVMLFCPELREWLIDVIGYNSADLIIEYYQLYGDEAITIQEIAHDQGLTPDHAERRQLWALKELYAPKAQEGLRDVLRSVVRQMGGSAE